jgi:hypothetical protein
MVEAAVSLNKVRRLVSGDWLLAISYQPTSPPHD